MERERVEVRSREEWRAWLAQNHASPEGVWVVTSKKGYDDHVPYEDLVLEALCFGWVDSQVRGVDERRTSIAMTPRRPASRWSRSNRDRVDALEAAGLMTAAGRAAVARARERGTWEG